MTNGLGVIEAGRRFTAGDMVFYRGKADGVPLDEVLPRVDLVVTGPHASAALPEELLAFVDSRLTRRLQLDFTDCSTAPVARAWAELDPRVLYVEDPHPRAVRDANRPRPADTEAALREAFARIRGAGEGARPSLAGVDATRPVTFGYLPVYREPRDDGEWAALAGTVDEVATRGVDAYEALRDDLTERVVEAKVRRLAGLDPATVPVAEWRTATTLHVLSFHDTMNTTARPDGAVCLERRPEDRLPLCVALSNRGDASGEVRATDDGTLLAAADVLSMPAVVVRALAQSLRTAFAVPAHDHVQLNRPYLGGHETTTLAPKLAALQPRTAVRTPGGDVVRLSLAAYQAEFCREFLLGEEAADHLRRPGTDWAEVPADRVAWLAEGLTEAHDLWRRWGTGLAR